MPIQRMLLACGAVGLIVLLARSLATAPVGAARAEHAQLADWTALVEPLPPSSLRFPTPTAPTTRDRSSRVGPMQVSSPPRTPTPINIGNFVWQDVNFNGVQDNGEPGVGGVVVQLWNADKSQM